MGYGQLTITPDPDRALNPLHPHDYPYTYKEAYEWKLFIVPQAENNFKRKGLSVILKRFYRVTQKNGNF